MRPSNLRTMYGQPHRTFASTESDSDLDSYIVNDPDDDLSPRLTI